MSTANGFVTFGFGQGDENIGKKNEKFKAEGGRTYRISFAWWPGIENGKFDLDAATPKFLGGPRHYIEGVGYIMNKGPEFTRIAGGPPRMAIGTVIVVWPTDSKGNLAADRLKDGDFAVMPWIFSEDKYNSFAPIHGEFHLGKYDLKLQCTDTKFQKMTFSPCKESLLRKLVESGDKGKSHVAAILAEVQRIAANLQSDIGREMTVEQLKDKLAGGSGQAAAGGSSNTVTEATTADIDGLVDGLLD